MASKWPSFDKNVTCVELWVQILNQNDSSPSKTNDFMLEVKNLAFVEAELVFF